MELSNTINEDIGYDQEELFLTAMRKPYLPIYDLHVLLFINSMIYQSYTARRFLTHSIDFSQTWSYQNKRKLNRYMGKGYIIELDSWPAFIIKQEVKKLSLDEVKQLASDTIKDFKQKGEMDEIINHCMDKLNISDDNQLFGFKLESADLKYNLFLNLQRLDSYNRKKEMWFTEEYWNRLKLLLIKYPNEHHTIMKSLRLPKSSFK